jgi:hypothetical protein
MQAIPPIFDGIFDLLNRGERRQIEREMQVPQPFVFPQFEHIMAEERPRARRGRRQIQEEQNEDGVPRGAAYKNEAKKHLYVKFPHLAQSVIDDIFKEHGSFTDTHNHITENYDQIRKMKRPNLDRVSVPRHPFLIREIERFNEVREELNGDEVECRCCYDLSRRVIRCSNDHPVCKKCVEKYVTEIIYGQVEPRLICLAGDCDHMFQPRDFMFLPKDLMTKFEEKQLQKGLSSLENFHRCPACSHGYIDEEINNTTFYCVNQDCRLRSCKKCRNEVHDGFTCEENTRRKETLSEKKSEALIRKCPSCLTRILRVEGCSKMYCTCGTYFCWVCRLQIDRVKPYDHFCRCPTTMNVDYCPKCKKCALYSRNLNDEIKDIDEKIK